MVLIKQRKRNMMEERREQGSSMCMYSSHPGRILKMTGLLH